MQDFKWGYINRLGEVVIKPQFEWAYDFSEGLAMVRYPNREKPLKPGQATPELIEGVGFIDETGKVVIESQDTVHLDGGFFRQGLTRFWTWDEGRGTLYGYIDKRGKVAIKAQFSSVGEFVEGLAAVCINNQDCGFIDTAGKFVVSPRFRTNRPFFDGMAAVGLDHEKIGFINRNGELVIEPQYGNIIFSNFSEDLAPVAYNHGKYGYIDKQGILVIPMKFDLALPFSEGLAAVNVDGKWGYIDKAGKLVIKPQFRSAGMFSEGLAPVNSEPSASRTELTGVDTGFIDKTGNVVIKLQFDGASSFVNGIAKVEVDGKWGYIDKKGYYIWKPTR